MTLDMASTFLSLWVEALGSLPPHGWQIQRWRAVCQLCGDRNGDPPWARSRQDQVKKEARVLILWGDYELLEFTQKIELEEWNSSTHTENLLPFIRQQWNRFAISNFFHFFALCFVLRKRGKFKHLQPHWWRLHCRCQRVLRNVFPALYFRDEGRSRLHDVYFSL